MAEDNARDIESLRKLRTAKSALADLLFDPGRLSPLTLPAIEAAMIRLEDDAERIEGAWN